MNHLTERMRAATDAPPPTTIDLDRFVAREQRRTRLLRWGGSGGALAVLVAAVLTLPALYAGGHDDQGLGMAGPACPTPGPNPTGLPERGPDPQEGPDASPPPEDACAATAARLSRALRDALAASLPDATAAPLASIAFVYQPRYAQYESDVALTGAASLRVEVKTVAENPPTEQRMCPAARAAAGRCAYRITRAGTVLLTQDIGFIRKAEAYRRDGTLISASAAVPVREGQSTKEVAPPPVTTQQLLAVVQAPGMGLAPDLAASPRPTRDRATEDLIDTIVLQLRRKLPDAAFAPSPAPGAPEDGLRVRYDVPGQGAVTVTVGTTCAGAVGAVGCVSPCPTLKDSVYCTVGTDGSGVVGGHGAVAYFTPSGRVFSVTAEGLLTQRLTALDLATIAEALAATPPR